MQEFGDQNQLLSQEGRRSHEKSKTVEGNTKIDREHMTDLGHARRGYDSEDRGERKVMKNSLRKWKVLKFTCESFGERAWRSVKDNRTSLADIIIVALIYSLYCDCSYSKIKKIIETVNEQLEILMTWRDT